MRCPICDREDKDDDFRECENCCRDICESCIIDYICYECEEESKS